MSEIDIANVAADGSVVECDLRTRGRVSRFFTGERFRVEYDVDVTDVPQSVLTIPALAHVAPVAWATGATVSVDRVDRRFRASLRTVRDALQEMYPEFMVGGDVDVAETVATLAPEQAERAAPGVGEVGGGPDRRSRRADGGGSDPTDGQSRRAGGSGQTDSALLFSGGVDSMATYVRHRSEDPLLISVHGWVVEEEERERWNHIQEYMTDFADEHGVEHTVVRSNMLSALDTPMLHAHYKRFIEGSWYSAVGHGLGLLSLCAPLAYARGIGDLYIAATHTAEFDEPWGSHPGIDDNVAWSGTDCHHDGYDYSRQEKIELIADFVQSEAPDLTLRTCINDGVGNCCECEKCYRTAVGLSLAGLDPADHGYELGPETFRAIRSGFEEGEWILGADEQFMWEDLQRYAAEADPDSAEAAAFYEWLADADFEAYVDAAAPPLTNRALRALARNAPESVYDSLYPLYRRISGALGA